MPRFSFGIIDGQVHGTILTHSREALSLIVESVADFVVVHIVGEVVVHQVMRRVPECRGDTE